MLGRRADGYHELDTIFQTVSLHDTIRISPTDSSDIIFSCDDRSLPADSGNLVIRAAKALRDRFEIRDGAHIRLEKRIPMQAGLGGGSSDAAVTLIGLSWLWRLKITREELASLAAMLGADVPFFLYGGTARGTGFGDRVEPVNDVPKKFLLIVKPKANISTADAYKALDSLSLTSQNPKTILSTSRATAESGKIDFQNLINDFESVVIDLEPEILRGKSALVTTGARTTLVAGSGAAVFGVFDNEDAQRRAIQTIELETGWRVFPCKTMGRDEYRRALGDLSQLLS